MKLFILKGLIPFLTGKINLYPFSPKDASDTSIPSNCEYLSTKYLKLP